MVDFNLNITFDGKIIEILDDEGALITQFDNNAQRLVFNRPEKYTDDNLILVFSSGFTIFEEQNIGTENEYVIPNALTQETKLNLSLYFRTQDGVRSIHSNVLPLTVRESRKGGTGNINPLPNGLQDLRDKAFTDVETDNSALRFKNMSGITVATVPLSGSGGSGSDGLSAYEIAVQNGFTGTVTEWLESLKGEQGPQGEQGPKGDTGEQGVQGVQGEKGDTGERGEQGVQGEKGDKGERGEQGVQGEKGDTGKSAYESAQDGGYAGTEAEFYTDLSALGGLADAILAITGGG